jgi:hypothetical protein
MNTNDLQKLLDRKNPPETPKGDRESVLRATFRPERPETPVRTAEDVLRGNEALKQFLKLKESL